MRDDRRAFRILLVHQERSYFRFARALPTAEGRLGETLRSPTR
jgi:hypothetical protein